MKITMFVKLVVPDNVAITAKRTLKGMGFELEHLDRYDYYEFDAEIDIHEKLSKVDILANANKHKVLFDAPDGINILATDRDDSSESLLNTLKVRLGLKDITSVKRGILWSFHGCNREDAEKMTRELLINEHYQDYKII